MQKLFSQEEYLSEESTVLDQNFEDLPIYDGSGSYHSNRFQVAFSPSQIVGFKQKFAVDFLRQRLVNDFMIRFESYVKSSAASVEWKPERLYLGKSTLKFTGTIPVLKAHLKTPHHDWVGIASQNKFGFTVQTLRYIFDDGTKFEPSFNKSHFLAGRRSWRIDTGSSFGYTDDFWVLETVAVERFSNWAFNLVGTLLGLEDAIKPVWTSLLNNYVTLNRYPRRNLKTRSGWKSLNNVSVFIKNFDSIEIVKCNPEFQQAWRLYPDILPPSLDKKFTGFGGGSFGGGGAGGVW